MMILLLREEVISNLKCSELIVLLRGERGKKRVNRYGIINAYVQCHNRMLCMSFYKEFLGHLVIDSHLPLPSLQPPTDLFWLILLVPI